MRKILFLGSSFGIVPIIKRAKSEGYYVIVTDYLERERSKAKQLADEAWDISTAELDLIEKRCRENEVSALLCGISEFNLDVLLELTERLHLACYCTKEHREYSKNKRKFKEICKELGIAVPKDYKLNELDKESFASGLELVVKPNDCAGSEGVSFCKNPGELQNAIITAREKSPSEEVIVERRLKGKEFFAVYCFADGYSSLITLNEMHSQTGYPSKCYSLVTNCTGYIGKFCKEADPSIRKIFKHIGYRNGCAWVQVILDEDGRFYLIEMGAEYRLPDMYPVCGFDYAKWQLRYALGKNNSIDSLPSLQMHMSGRLACEYLFWTSVGDSIEEIVIDEKLEKSGITVEMLFAEGDKVEAYRIIGHALYYPDNKMQLNEMTGMINALVRVYGKDGRDIIIHYTDEIV